MSEESHAIEIQLDRLLGERQMTLTDLADRVGIAYPNLSILKTNHARAIRFSTLTRLCEVLDCQPCDLLHFAGPTGPDQAAARPDPDWPAADG